MKSKKLEILVRLALFQPDIPQNTGTMLRLAACFGLGVDIIEPCGFLLDDKRMRRAGMDYLHKVDMTRHPSWADFLANRDQGRLILLSTKATTTYTNLSFLPTDTLLLGRESAGVPPEVQAQADASIIIPMSENTRSLNVALSAGIVVGEALRQTDGFP